MTQIQQSLQNIQNVAYAATITPNPDQGEIVTVTLTGNLTIANPGRALPGMRLVFILTQDATGGRTVTWGNAFNTVAQLAPAANAVSIVVVQFDGTLWQQLAGGLAIDQNGNVTVASGLFRESSTVAVTAFAGGGQAGATALTTMFNRVTTSVAAVAPYDSVKLPASAPGLDVVVVNATANPIQVFGAGADQINGLAAAVGLTQPPNSVDFYACTVAGQWNVDPGIGFSGQLFTELAQDNITAFAGGGQAGATLLTAQTSRVATVATAGDSIKLPVSAPGLELLVINHGLNSMQVYGSGTDTIDDIATATGVSQMTLSMVIYTCATAGKWYTNGIGTGFSGQFPTVSFLNNITALAGGGQALATLLTNVINRVVTVATAGDSVKLPVSAGGMQITVTNAHAVNSLNVFPNTGEQINALGVNAAFALPAGKTAAFSCAVAGTWHAVLGA